MAETIRILQMVVTGSEQNSHRKALGSAVAIIVFINVGSADSAKITIEDPFDGKIVNDVDMTKISNGIYCFTFQSTHFDNGGLVGLYEATVKLVLGTFTASSSTVFELEEVA